MKATVNANARKHARKGKSLCHFWDVCARVAYKSTEVQQKLFFLKLEMGACVNGYIQMLFKNSYIKDFAELNLANFNSPAHINTQSPFD